MKLRLLFILLLTGTLAQAQEYWDREDFEISNRSIENTWREFSFNWQAQSNFNLPDGSFLHLKNHIQDDQIDMLAAIDKMNRNRIQQEVDLGSPLPQRKTEKKIFEISAELRTRDKDDIFMNPYYPTFLNSYNQRGFGSRRYTNPYNYNY
ncbi:hypothetical protein [Christiangramia forsetii]|uniref:Secreted protein n=2 Tax=Christiangramia forsetii TaxID=411153 RepID=A0M342_CHRFK|nr:hypothetical protein [Christiangramia forsetii]GGG26810.1 hypothetical protein GCM10011532_07780 [Christiangramia forsetii]CAL67037.1 secreted protein [Christiangramia forsetii KT0803]